MRTFSDKNDIYIGQEAGKELLAKIKNAKNSVKIVSPYLSASYIKELLYLHKKGVKITLITCDKLLSENSTKYSDISISDLIKETKIPNKNAGNLRKLRVGTFSVLLFLSLMSFSLSILVPFFLYVAFSFLIISIGVFVSVFRIQKYVSTYNPLFRIKVFDSTSGNKPWSTELIHSKMFVIDDTTAYLGSLNFTYSGFVTHYETIIKIQDIEAIRAISEEVENLYTSEILRAKTIDEWG